MGGGGDKRRDIYYCSLSWVVSFTRIIVYNCSVRLSADDGESLFANGPYVGGHYSVDYAII